MMRRRKSSASCTQSPDEFEDQLYQSKTITISKDKSRCKFNDSGRINLKDALLSFNGPVSQERGWALCYQTAKCLSNFANHEFYQIFDLSQILLDDHGNVYLDHLADSQTPVSEQTAIFSLGMALYDALDFGVNPDEERPLSPDLEALISFMTSEESKTETEERLQETDDEGIERDSGDGDIDEFPQKTENNIHNEKSPNCTLKAVQQLCVRHIQSTNEYAESHYCAVMRAFVAEASELSKFLERIAIEKRNAASQESPFSDGSQQCARSLDTLDINDWTDVRIWRAIQARFWVQVIGELRRGVKLKKVEENLNTRSKNRSRGAEFELTPYEILMDDIRERRYRLRKTPTHSSSLKKDARAIILEFIRSRPALKKASERQLPPLQKQATLRELLMESIKKPPKPLRPTGHKLNVPRLDERSPSNVGGESRRIVLGEVPPKQSEQEQEPAQDVAAQWLQNESGPHPSSSGVPPVPQPRTRLNKLDKMSGSRNQSLSDDVEGKSSELPPKPPQRDLDGTNPLRKTSRKLIPVDFDLKLDAEDDDDEDYSEGYVVTRFNEEDDESDYWRTKKTSQTGHNVCSHDHGDDDDDCSANPWRKTGGLRLTKNEYHRFCDAQLESYDLATQCPSRRASQRKHAARRNIPLVSLTGTTSLPHSRPQSRQQTGLTEPTMSQGPSPNISLNPSPSLSPQPRARQMRRAHTIANNKENYEPNEGENEDNTEKPTLGDMFLDERLSLTLEEIVHIRSVLTKAELESLPVEGRVKEDVEKRRVCFLCLKTRFGILGPWGQRCRLCERTVCVKCYSKMRIPTEHFAHVPVVLLSPGLLMSPTSESDNGDKNSWLRASGAVGSAPASPASRRKDSARSSTPGSTPAVTPISIVTPTSLSVSHPRDTQSIEKRMHKNTGSPAALSTTKAFSTQSGINPEQRLAAERLRGVAMVVCHDCRIMVIQIIKSSRTTRATIRNNVISRLTLNLSPAYV